MLHKALLAVAALAVVVLSVGTAIQPSDAQTTQPSGEYQIDLAHASIYFRIEHLGYSYVYGRFNEFDGSFKLDGEDSSFDVTIKANSVDTGNKKRDDHLRGPDFFNAKQHRVIRFKSKDVTVSGDTYKVTGDLTLHGKTRQINIDVKLHGAGKGMRPGVQRAGVDAEFKIDRTKHGMVYGVDKGIVGKDVHMFVSIEGTKK